MTASVRTCVQDAVLNINSPSVDLSIHWHISIDLSIHWHISIDLSIHWHPSVKSSHARLYHLWRSSVPLQHHSLLLSSLRYPLACLYDWL